MRQMHVLGNKKSFTFARLLVIWALVSKNSFIDASNDPSTGSESGFTLIELLTVVAIIAILAGLILSSLSKAKSKANLIVCQNNLRQIAIGMNVYLSDFHAFPPHADPNAFWFERLTPYVGARWPQPNITSANQVATAYGTYACPDYSRLSGLYYDHRDSVAGTAWGAYGYNDKGVDWGKIPPVFAKGLGGAWLFSPTISFQETREGEVVQPTEMIGFGDSSLSYPKNADGSAVTIGTLISPNMGFTALEWGIADPVFNSAMSQSAKAKRKSLNSRRHSGLFNISFIDAHVEKGPLEQFYQIRGHPERARRWNVDNQPHLDLITPVIYPPE